ncbi:MAG: hypothetical protein ACHP7M_12800, partial [Burkholderiales bacterium]
MRNLIIGRTLPAAALFALLWASAAAAVPTFTVNDTSDLVDDDVADAVCHTAAGTCTLRAAVMQANRADGLGAIIVLPAGTYVLTLPPTGADGEDSGDLDMTTPASGDPLITLQGAGEANTIIDANRLDNVLRVHASRTVTILGVTMRGGSATGDGGGIFNEGYLALQHVRLTGNTAQAGGAINNLGQLIAVRCAFTANIASLSGGAIQNNGTAHISLSTLAFNTAAYGGGIENYADLTLIDSTLAGNEATKDGGGITALGSPGVVTNIYSSTIAFNDADEDRDGVGSGGGIYLGAGSSGSGLFAIRNTLVTGNTVGNTPIYDDCTVESGTVLYSYGRNLLGTSDGCAIV